MRDLSITYDRNGDGTLYTGTFDATYLPLRSTNGQIEGTIQTTVETTRYTAAIGGTT